MKELFVFDFDGTLVDSYRDSIKYFNVTLMEFDLPTFDDDVENLDYQIFREFIHRQIEGIEEEFMERFTINYMNGPQDNTRPYDGVVDVLARLVDEGLVLGICSNRNQENLEDLINVLFDGVDFKYVSGEVKGLPNKPDPFRLNQLICRAGVDKDNVLYFGDKVADIEAARACGVDMVLVSYGQGNDEAYCDSYPLRIIDDVLEILDFL